MATREPCGAGDGRDDDPGTGSGAGEGLYAEKLGLTPTSEERIGLRYRLADGTRFRLFRSGGKASGAHTQMALIVEDLAAVVTELRSRGLTFEEYDSPGLKTTDGIADVGYARAAWFKDSEGNLVGISQPNR